MRVRVGGRKMRARGSGSRRRRSGKRRERGGGGRRRGRTKRKSCAIVVGEKEETEEAALVRGARDGK